MGRKQRIKERDEKRKKREESNFKKSSYHEMAHSGKLGQQDLEKYTFLYYELKKEEQHNFVKPDNNPTRTEYNKLKSYYYSHKNSSIDNLLLN